MRTGSLSFFILFFTMFLTTQRTVAQLFTVIGRDSEGKDLNNLRFIVDYRGTNVAKTVTPNSTGKVYTIEIDLDLIRRTKVRQTQERGLHDNVTLVVDSPGVGNVRVENLAANANQSLVVVVTGYGTPPGTGSNPPLIPPLPSAKPVSPFHHTDCDCITLCLPYWEYVPSFWYWPYRN